MAVISRCDGFFLVWLWGGPWLGYLLARLHGSVDLQSGRVATGRAAAGAEASQLPLMPARALRDPVGGIAYDGGGFRGLFPSHGVFLSVF